MVWTEPASSSWGPTVANGVVYANPRLAATVRPRFSFPVYSVRN